MTKQIYEQHQIVRSTTEWAIEWGRRLGNDSSVKMRLAVVAAVVIFQPAIESVVTTKIQSQF